MAASTEQRTLRAITGSSQSGAGPCPSPLEVAPGRGEAGQVTSNKASPACSEHGYFLATASARHETCNDPIEPTDSAAPGPGRGPRRCRARPLRVLEVKPVEGGPAGLITALQSAIGHQGTLVMLSMTDVDDQPYDPRVTPCMGMGVVANTFWQLPGVLRSNSPYAFAASGPHAARIAAGHPVDVPHGLKARLRVSTSWTDKCSCSESAMTRTRPSIRRRTWPGFASAANNTCCCSRTGFEGKPQSKCLFIKRLRDSS